jgi:hypothetical protein
MTLTRRRRSEEMVNAGGERFLEAMSIVRSVQGRSSGAGAAHPGGGGGFMTKIGGVSPRWQTARGGIATLSCPFASLVR